MEIEANSQSFEIPEAYIENLNKYRVVVMRANGVSYSEIEKKTGILRGTAHKLFNKSIEFGDVLIDLRAAKSGRGSILEEEVKEEVIIALAQKNRVTLTEIQNQILDQFKLDVSVPTLYRFASEIGSWRKPELRAILSEKNRNKRLDYCKEHFEDKFSNVIFTDECSFCLTRNTMKVFVFRGDEVPTKLIGDNYTSIMIWGAVSRKGKIGYAIIRGTLKADNYQDLLEEFFPEVPNKKYGIKKWRFLQDSAPPHRPKDIKEWISGISTGILNHPPQSPDLNAIELVWALMKKHVERERPLTKLELVQAIENAWNDVSSLFINNCIDHICDMVKAVYKNKGYYLP